MDIIINGVGLDLFPGTEENFFVTKQLFDLFNFNRRASDYSRTFSVPYTYHNRELLSMESNVKASNTFISCSVLIGNINLIPNGNINVLTWNSQAIEIVIYFENFSLFNSIPNESIRNLDLSAYDYDFDKTTIAGKVSDTSGVVYAKHLGFNQQEVLEIPFGNRKQLIDNIDIKACGFFFYAKTLFQEIVEQAGFVYDGSGLSSLDDYDELAIYCPVYDTVGIDQNNPIICEIGKTSDFSHDGNTDGSEQKIPFETAISDANNLFDNANDRIEFDFGANYRIDFNYELDIIKVPCLIEIRKNAAGTVLDQAQFDSVGTVTGTFSYEGFLSSVDYVEFWVSTPEENDDNEFGSLTVDSNTTVKAEEITTSIGTIKVNKYLPNISQREFFLFFLKYFCALSYPSKTNTTISFKTINSLLADTPQNIDQNIIEVKEVIERNLYFQRSKLVYDNEDNLQFDPDYEIEIDGDLTAPPVGNVLSFPFSASERSLILDDLTADQNPDRVQIPAYGLDVSTEDNFSVSNGSASFTFGEAAKFDPGDYIITGTTIARISTKTSEVAGTFYFSYSGTTVSNGPCYIVKFTQNNIKDRLVKINQSNTSGCDINVNGFPDSSPTSSTMFEAEFVNLTMESIYNSYYSSLFDALKTPKIIRVWAEFSALEIYQIDMTKPVFSQRLNGLYYINKIEQWKVNKPCLVELIRLNKI